MSRQIQIRRGTAAENDAFTGAVGEITMDTTNNTLRVHDGETLGGTKLAKQSDIPEIDTSNFIKYVNFSTPTVVSTTTGETYTATHNEMLVCTVGFGVAGTSELMVLKDATTTFTPENLLIGINVSNWTTMSNQIYLKAGQSIYIYSRYGSVNITSYPAA